MSKSEYFPQKVYVEKGSFDFPLTQRILKNVGSVPREVIGDPQEVLEDIKVSKDVIGAGKKYLLIARQKGEFVKPCPCTPGYLGCNYFILNLDLNCPLDCSYCILQHYLTNPLITVHVNLDDLWRQLDIFLKRAGQRTIRLGTGELGDSLALDHLTGNSIDLVSYFRKKRKAIFELKTKTVNIINILKIDPAPNIVIAWSLNSARIASEEEKGAPSVEERIDAARRVSERGFRTGFHFDPIIRHPDWEDGYREVIKKLLKSVDPTGIAWISLGTFRFPPCLKAIIEERFPSTKIVYDEFIKGKDGKLRYFRPLRLELYKKILGFIREAGGKGIPLYFCMESEDVWREAMGWIPRGKKNLEKYLSSPLDQSLT
jgi:spore photoproduct lyase